jgi:hypothetical protein
MAERDELDRLLDSALASYSDAEPLAGIEERVLRRVARSKRRPWLWWLAGAVPAAACLLVLLTNREAIAPPQLPVAPRAVETAQTRPEPAVVKAPPKPRPVQRRPQVARQDQFPIAMPLTAQERGLLELAAVAPEALLVKPAVAIEIEPIQIKPLDLSGTN